MDVRRQLPRLGAAAGWLTAAAFVVAGVPLFLRMPPWCDLTLYDMAARAVMHGGTLYKDIFDTNLPGFVWCLVGIRRAFGPGVEVVRTVDLVFVTAITLLLVRLVRRGGGTAAGTAWMVALLAAFYLFTSEYCHCQRDIWMLLPALAATTLRLNHLAKPMPTRRDAIIEGVVWGLGVWFKPHVAVIALVVWRMTRPADLALRRQDLRGNVLGGAVVGLAGIVWLVASGTWKPFVEVFTKWNSHYVGSILGDVPNTLGRLPVMFGLLSLLHAPGVALAVGDLRKHKQDDLHRRRGAMAALYLAFLLTGVFLQRNFDYVHVPNMMLLFAVLALRPRSGAWVLAGSLAAVMAVSAFGPASWRHVFAVHPLLKPERQALWADCFRTGLPPHEYRARMKALGLMHEYHPQIDVVEIGEVADWLRTQDVHDGDVIAWHDSPHAVYLELDIGTNFRFMHLITTLIGPDTYGRACRELQKKALPTARFVVTDLAHTYRTMPDDTHPYRVPGPDGYPPTFTDRGRAIFPYCLPVVFRSDGGRGRYLVHRVTPGIADKLIRDEVKMEFHVLWWEKD